MNYQDSDILNPISDAGCYAVSLSNMGEFSTGRKIEAEKLREVLFSEVLNGKLGSVDPDMLVTNPDNFLKEIGYPELKQKLNNKSIEFPPDYKCLENEFEILVFKYKYTHYVLGDSTGKVLVDPIYSGSNSVKNGNIISKRIFVRSI